MALLFFSTPHKHVNKKLKFESVQFEVSKPYFKLSYYYEISCWHFEFKNSMLLIIILVIQLCFDWWHVWCIIKCIAHIQVLLLILNRRLSCVFNIKIEYYNAQSCVILTTHLLLHLPHPPPHHLQGDNIMWCLHIAISDLPLVCITLLRLASALARAPANPLRSDSWAAGVSLSSTYYYRK